MGALGVDYDYGPVPTIRDFARSNAEIRGLMGPFGCLSGSSEYLSPAGWRRMDEYDGGQVAVWSDGLVEWEVPAGYIEQPCTNLIRFDSGSLVMELSDEHRVPHWDWKGEFAVKTAAEIAEHPSRGTIPTTFVLARKDSALSEDIIRFGVMFSADGHVPPQGKQVQVCLRKDRKKARLRALLQRLGIKWVERCYPTRPTETTFVFESAWANKSLDWVWHLSSAELEVVIDEILEGKVTLDLESGKVETHES